MTHDILTRIKDACDRAVAEGFTISRDQWGVMRLFGKWEATADRCLCAMSCLIRGQPVSVHLIHDGLHTEVAKLLGLQLVDVKRFITGFDNPNDGEFYDWGGDEWEDLGHACALYYVDGVRL